MCIFLFNARRYLNSFFVPFSLVKKTEMIVKNRLSLYALFIGIFIIDTTQGLYIDKRQQKDAIKTPYISNLRPLVWGDVNFIHTTDTHGNNNKICIYIYIYVHKYINIFFCFIRLVRSKYYCLHIT